MSTFASIFDANNTPIFDGGEIGADTEFEALAIRAEEFAAAGTKCCIRWEREEDGQVAYWGAQGATLKPYWYTKPGRPEEMQGGKRRNVYLDDASWAEAVKRGNGNASEGIRKALDCGG